MDRSFCEFFVCCIRQKCSFLQLDVDTRKLFRHLSVEENEFLSDIFLSDGRRIWMKLADLCPLILNVMLMLEKVPCGTLLDE